MQLRSLLPAAAALAVLLGTATAPASAAVLEIKTVSNRADLVSGDDVLVEITPAPVAGTVITLNGADITSDFALRPNGKFMALVTGLDLGGNTLTATEPGGSGATLSIENHPIQGPIFAGPHLEPWDCTTQNNGLGAPDANCNAPKRVEYLYKSTGGGGYQSYDIGNPPGDVANVTTDQGNTVRNIIYRESGTVNRGLYAFAVLHDPATSPAPIPWDPQPGFNGKLHYPFGASCNTNQTQGSGKTGTVTIDIPLSRGYAVATTSLNELGHHCNPILSAETAMMAKEIVIENLGPPRFTTGRGDSGGSIGQLVVSNAYPGIVNGLLPGLTYPGIWSNAMEVGDCLLSEAYWPQAAIPFTGDQRAAVDGHGQVVPGEPPTTCASWVALFVPAGLPTTGCFSGSTLPGTSQPEARDYNPVTNPDGCRATTHDIQANVIGRRGRDDFAKFPLANLGVQYGLEAVNRPLTDLGRISFAQFLDLNTKIGGTDIDGVPTVDRWRMPPQASRNVHRSSLMNDTSNLDKVAIIDLPSTLNEEIHTPYHSYAIEARLIANHGHADNQVIWRGIKSLLGGSVHAVPFDTMDQWMENIEAAGGIDPLYGMDPAKIVPAKPGIAQDGCFIGGTGAANLSYDDAACDAEYPIYADARIAAGMPASHDVIECTLKAIDPADYAGVTPPLTAADLLALEAIFPEGVCDYTQPSLGKEPAIAWLTYENGPGGEPLGPPPTSVGF